MPADAIPAPTIDTDRSQNLLVKSPTQGPEITTIDIENEYVKNYKMTLNVMEAISMLKKWRNLNGNHKGNHITN